MTATVAYKRKLEDKTERQLVVLGTRLDATLHRLQQRHFDLYEQWPQNPVAMQQNREQEDSTQERLDAVRFELLCRLYNRDLIADYYMGITSAEYATQITALDGQLLFRSEAEQIAFSGGDGC